MKKIISTYTGPSIVTFAFFIILFLYTGIGFSTIIANSFLTFLMFIISIILIEIVNINKKNKDKTAREKAILNTALSIITGLCMFIALFKIGNDDEYKKAFFPENYAEYFDIQKSRTYYVAMEYELFVKAKFDEYGIVNEMITNEEYRQLDEYDISEISYDGPYWFPDESDNEYDFYEVNDSRNEVYKLMIISTDKETLYGYYLEY